MVVDCYGFLQIPTLTSHFPASAKTWLPRQFCTLGIMADSEESVGLVYSAVSNPSEDVASSSTASETHRDVRNSLIILSILCSLELLPNSSQILYSSHFCLTTIPNHPFNERFVMEGLFLCVNPNFITVFF